MKVPKSDFHFLNTHAVKIDGVWICKKTDFPITFEEKSSFLKLKPGERYERASLITFIHCSKCNPEYKLPPVEKAYSDDEIIELEDYMTVPPSTENVIITGHICPT